MESRQATARRLSQDGWEAQTAKGVDASSPTTR